MSAQERQKLQIFMTDVYAWLSACHGAPAAPNATVWPTVRPRKDLRGLAASAWLELEQGLPLSSVVAQIGNLPDQKLRDHGLKGVQLDYKLAVVDHLAQRISSARTPGRLRPKLIDAIDTILDSLLGALALGTALKELKDMLRAQI